MDELIEAVARAIQIAAMSGHVEAADRSWNENNERYREEWRVQARAAIAAVQAHEAIVPKALTRTGLKTCAPASTISADAFTKP